MTTTKRSRMRRALAHQCRECRRHWALHSIQHPSGLVILCRDCGTVRSLRPVSPLALPG